MAVERIDKNEDIAIDENMEIRTPTYTIKELQGGGPGCVISQPHAVRYFQEKNPELAVKQVYNFKMNHAGKTVTLKIRVTKRRPVGSELATKSVEELIAEREPITDPAKLLNAGPEE